ncbi:hypothetical protein ACFOGG_04855 [Brenneria rubrifaciens]|uniref:hypothetical protein n=1 Tax=Brenneria rubrifaciens TaxID=55213 RepID=UPI003613D66E
MSRRLYIAEFYGGPPARHPSGRCYATLKNVRGVFLWRASCPPPFGPLLCNVEKRARRFFMAGLLPATLRAF